MKETGKRIRERREFLRMTQDELAQKLGYKSRCDHDAGIHASYE